MPSGRLQLMNAALSSLRLERRVRPGEEFPGGGHRTERPFWDFVIDGISLYDAVAREYDLTSVLWIRPPVQAAVEPEVRRLLLLDPGDLPDGRVALFTCPECGDLGCGGITVDIEIDGDAIVWRRFGYQNNYDEKLDTDSFQQFGPFRFDLKRYR